MQLVERLCALLFHRYQDAGPLERGFSVILGMPPRAPSLYRTRTVWGTSLAPPAHLLGGARCGRIGFGTVAVHSRFNSDSSPILDFLSDLVFSSDPVTTVAFDPSHVFNSDCSPILDFLSDLVLSSSSISNSRVCAHPSLSFYSTTDHGFNLYKVRE
ncbi:hypothetical protein EVAR_103574_1 [Eumeta japonica]|uniref:Uncharacterized protein n=1 Tax=Eumeta variegata TaxID=151549 RepID=A0A4C1ZZ32_EUMVA|nr:hypothetical protein EVAR_103574_1 [Eumeta japonica]